MARRIIDRITGVLSTTDATQTVLLTWAIPSNSVASFTFMVNGRDGSNNATAKSMSGIVKNVAGTASLVGSLSSLLPLTADVALSTTLVTADVSGTNLRVLVTGVLATNIEWFGDLQVWNN